MKRFSITVNETPEDQKDEPSGAYQTAPDASAERAYQTSDDNVSRSYQTSDQLSDPTADSASPEIAPLAD